MQIANYILKVCKKPKKMPDSWTTGIKLPGKHNRIHLDDEHGWRLDTQYRPFNKKL
jgi:hypothetical protein